MGSSSTLLCASCAAELPDPRTSAAELADARCPRCADAVVLDARYVLESVVGAGAMGMTYAARRLVDGQRVAIKELAFRTLDTLKMQELFEREAQILAQLDHPSIPDLIESFMWGVGKRQALYIVEEFVSGHTLADALRTHRYTEDEALQIAGDVLKTLRYLHELSPPVIHRDIKPHNLMRRDDGRLMLIDFGSVRDGLAETIGGSTVAGTFGYMAPEVFQGRPERASDIYAVGVLVVHLLTRRPPHELLNARGALEWSRHLPDVHPATRHLLADMLKPEAARRADDARLLRRRVKQLRRHLRAPDAHPLTTHPLTRRVTADPIGLDEDSSALVTLDDRALMPAEPPHQESLFGLVCAFVGVPAIFSVPCLLAVTGSPGGVIIAASVLMLVLMVVMPFVSSEA